MHVSKWITRVRKSVRSKKSPLRSPRLAQAAGVAVIVLVVAAAFVVAAHPPDSPVDVVSPLPVKAMVAKASASAKKSGAPPSHAPATAQAAHVPDAVTITGCLERSHDEFRLKDTQGADAPKSRTWKTGFLTKHSATIAVIDAADRLKLADRVGDRVSVSGTLEGREMDARRVERIGACES